MKRCLLGILGVLCFTSSSAFAMHMESAKLISHKEWGADNVKLSFKATQSDQNKVKLLMAQAKAKDINSDQLAEVFTKVTGFLANSVGQASVITANSGFLILNETSSSQLYTVKRMICPMKINESDNSVAFDTCSYISDIVSVEPKAYSDSQGTINFMWSPREAGLYIVSVLTSVQNNENTILFETGDTTSMNIPEAVKK